MRTVPCAVPCERYWAGKQSGLCQDLTPAVPAQRKRPGKGARERGAGSGRGEAAPAGPTPSGLTAGARGGAGCPGGRTGSVRPARGPPRSSEGLLLTAAQCKASGRGGHVCALTHQPPASPAERSASPRDQAGPGLWSVPRRAAPRGPRPRSGAAGRLGPARSEAALCFSAPGGRDVGMVRGDPGPPAGGLVPSPEGSRAVASQRL